MKTITGVLLGIGGLAAAGGAIYALTRPSAPADIAEFVSRYVSAYGVNPDGSRYALTPKPVMNYTTNGQPGVLYAFVESHEDTKDNPEVVISVWETDDYVVLEFGQQAGNDVVVEILTTPKQVITLRGVENKWTAIAKS